MFNSFHPIEKTLLFFFAKLERDETMADEFPTSSGMFSKILTSDYLCTKSMKDFIEEKAIILIILACAWGFLILARQILSQFLLLHKKISEIDHPK